MAVTMFSVTAVTIQFSRLHPNYQFLLTLPHFFQHHKYICFNIEQVWQNEMKMIMAIIYYNLSFQQYERVNFNAIGNHATHTHIWLLFSCQTAKKSTKKLLLSFSQRKKSPAAEYTYVFIIHSVLPEMIVKKIE